MTDTYVTPDTLNSAIEFDHPFTVHPVDDSGRVRVTDGPDDIYAPDLTDDEPDSDRWTFVDGYSGQHGYSGPIMHNSEYLGGQMARDVLANPGTYVCVVSRYLCTDDEHANGDPVTDDDPRETWTDDAGNVHTYVSHDNCEDYVEGWALLRLNDDV